ncbi:uncharacterized protein T551_01853, partial [Pneumocystis jirovecii RU7]
VDRDVSLFGGILWFKKECSYENESEKIKSICVGLRLLHLTLQTLETIIKNITIKKTTVIMSETDASEKILTKGEKYVSTYIIDMSFVCMSIHTKTLIYLKILMLIFKITLTITLISTKGCKPVNCIIEDEAGHKVKQRYENERLAYYKRDNINNYYFCYDLEKRIDK